MLLRNYTARQSHASRQACYEVKTGFACLIRIAYAYSRHEALALYACMFASNVTR